MTVTREQRAHLRKIAPLGGRATYRKRGSRYFKRIANSRWRKEREEKQHGPRTT